MRLASQSKCLEYGIAKQHLRYLFSKSLLYQKLRHKRHLRQCSSQRCPVLLTYSAALSSLSLYREHLTSSFLYYAALFIFIPAMTDGSIWKHEIRYDWARDELPVIVSADGTCPPVFGKWRWKRQTLAEASHCSPLKNPCDFQVLVYNRERSPRCFFYSKIWCL